MTSFASRWLQKKFEIWVKRGHRRELEQWLAKLRLLDPHAIALIVIVATDLRHKIERKRGVDLLDPSATYARDPDIIFFLHDLIKSFHSHSTVENIAGAMVWLHTIRCGASPELQPLGRELWAELQRGFPHPHIDDAAESLQALSDQEILMEGATRIPNNLSTSSPIL